jgi:hypothetical protein
LEEEQHPLEEEQLLEPEPEPEQEPEQQQEEEEEEEHRRRLGEVHPGEAAAQTRSE